MGQSMSNLAVYGDAVVPSLYSPGFLAFVPRTASSSLLERILYSVLELNDDQKRQNMIEERPTGIDWVRLVLLRERDSILQTYCVRRRRKEASCPAGSSRGRISK